MSAAAKTVQEIPSQLEWFNVAAPVVLSDLYGRLVLLEFTDGSAVACNNALPEISHLAERFRDDLQLLYVHVPGYASDARRNGVLQFIDRLGIRYPVVHDPDRLISQAFGVSQLPTHVLLDRDGSLIGTLTGNDKLGQLEKVIHHRLGRQWSHAVPHPVPVRLQAPVEPAGALCYPGRISASSDRLYISDSGHNRILVTSLRGHVIRQYGARSGGFIDGVGVTAAFRNPQGLLLLDNFLYVADTGNHAIRRINLQNDEVVTVAGDGSLGHYFPGLHDLPADTPLNAPLDLAHQAGRLFIAMAGTHQIWRLSLLNNSLERFAGGDDPGHHDGVAARARFNQPSGLVMAGRWLYCVDAISAAVRRIDPLDGTVSTLLAGRDGSGTPGTTELAFPQAIATDPQRKRLWVADSYNDRICQIDSTNGSMKVLPLEPGLNRPHGLVFGNNTLYIANTGAHRIVRADPDNGPVHALDVSEEYNEI